MIVNSGLKFVNMIGEYRIFDFSEKINNKDETIRLLECSNEFTPVFVYNSFSNERVLYDFLAIDHNNENDILNFYSRYGSIIKNTPHEGSTPFKTGYMLSFIQNIIVRTQSLVDLITAIKTNDLKSILINTLFLLLDEESQSIAFDSTFSIFGFNEYYLCAFYYKNSYVENGHPTSSEWDEMTIQERLEIILKHNKIPEEFDLEYSIIIDMFIYLKSICTIVDTNLNKLVIFKEDIENILYNIEKNAADTIKTCAGIVVSTEINSNIYAIRPYFRSKTDGSFSGDWKIPDLLSALYMDIFLKQTNSVLLKKCENPTCKEYFEVPVGNNRKKYCSIHCSQLMAKRKQREREKSKKS